jgi:predicted  nucleic acid-binding Zn-ribbon protein
MQQQKISKLRDQMLGAKTNEQYRAFQNEISFCETEIRKFEDRILDLMGESEALEKAVKTAEESLKVERAEVEKEKEQARQRTAIDKEKLAVLGKTRGELVSEMSPKVVSLYERLRKSRGVAVAEVVDGRCAACHIAMRLQYLQDLKEDRQVMPCESCGRILFYNPPVQVEDVAGATTQS